MLVVCKLMHNYYALCDPLWFDIDFDIDFELCVNIA